jgi:hypothetical protein
MGKHFEVARYLLSERIESKAVEIKNWIDLQTPEGIAKLVKAVIALRTARPLRLVARPPIGCIRRRNSARMPGFSL